MKKNSWDTTGFELGTLRQWILHATKRASQTHNFNYDQFVLYKQKSLFQKIYAQQIPK